MKTAVIILLAGNSERFNSKIKKQFFSINSKPLIYYTISSFENCNEIDEITLVGQKNDFETINEIINNFKFKKITQIIEGGKTRKESVYKGLMSLNIDDNDIVLIHDGARPLVSSEFTSKIIAVTKKCDAATAAIKVEDTLAKSVDGKSIDSFENRENFYRIQTPQAFKFGLIKKAHQTIKVDATDDAQLIESLGKKVALVIGDKKMNKVTTLEDAFFIESIIKNDRI